jgi:hypothetical protein
LQRIPHSGLKPRGVGAESPTAETEARAHAAARLSAGTPKKISASAVCECGGLMHNQFGFIQKE